MIVFFTNVVSVAHVTGSSMQPTFNPNISLLSDLLLVDRMSASSWSTFYGETFGMWKPEFRRGDVVMMKSPIDPKDRVIKRIVAVENDFVKTLPPYSAAVVQVPEGHVWVEGDEPFRSRDSNTYGPVSIGLIQGKVKHIIWPLSRFGPIPSLPNPTRWDKRVFSTRSALVQNDTIAPFMLWGKSHPDISINSMNTRR